MVSTNMIFHNVYFKNNKNYVAHDMIIASLKEMHKCLKKQIFYFLVHLESLTISIGA
jgi:hypothetical protein